MREQGLPTGIVLREQPVATRWRLNAVKLSRRSRNR